MRGQHWRRAVSLTSALYLSILLVGRVDAAPRPRNLVSVKGVANPSTAIVLATSATSSALSQSKFDASAVGNPLSLMSTISVQAPSWGVCVINDNQAIVTHPDKPSITVLKLIDDAYVVDHTVSAPLGCTEIIPGTAPDQIIVACRGQSTFPSGSGNETWTHAVYEIDVKNGSIVHTFVTEREPRALALSPNKSVLFVGTIQGNLGGTPLTSNEQNVGRPGSSFDGGSVIAYEVATGSPLYRIPVGSPVRGMAILPDPSVPEAARPSGLGNKYILYFTNVGDGAQGEAPSLGGRCIPNVVTAVWCDPSNSNLPVDRKDFLVRHDPEHPDVDSETPTSRSPNQNLPAVLPEKLALRWIQSAGGSYTWRLYVTNSGSGTVTQFAIDATTGGPVLMAPANDVDLSSLSDCNSTHYFAVNPARRYDAAALLQSDMVTPIAGSALTHFQRAESPLQYLVDNDVDPATAFTSEPLGIVWSSDFDEVFVVTALDEQLIAWSGNGVAISPWLLWLNSGGQAPSQAERNFFSFGRGFHFRESEQPATNRVHTLTCATCHVDGHEDGKVRVTSVPQTPTHGKLVAVPSCFDTGTTEWLFFDGLKTVADGTPYPVSPGTGPNDHSCDYCIGPVTLGGPGQGFFFDTRGFTSSLQSPKSPFAPPSGSVTASDVSILRGRSYFERMNCQRCHQGSLPIVNGSTSFTRTLVQQMPAPSTTSGPLVPAGLGQKPFTRLLFDMAQVLVTNTPGFTQADELSQKNGTNVGTRVLSDIPGAQRFFTHINTPALGGAWDNAPYMHDGRYRTLEEALDHTWVHKDSDGEYRSAPLWDPAAPSQTIVPDNAFNATNPTDPPPPPVRGVPVPFYEFHTHQPSSPGSEWRTVSDFLTTFENAGQSPNTQAVKDLLAFIRSASAQTDFCGTALVPKINLQANAVPISCGVVRYSWTTTSGASTPYPISCQYSVDGGPTQWTPVGSTHTVDVSGTPGQSVTMTINTGTTLCDKAANPKAKTLPIPACGTMTLPYGSLALECAQTGPEKVVVRLSVGTVARVRLDVFDVTGRMVATVLDRDLSAGVTEAEWNVSDRAGRRAPSGIYFVRASFGGSQSTRRIVIVK